MNTKLKKTLLLLTVILTTALVQAQEVKVLSFQLKTMDMTAKLDPVYDLNKEACALIRIAVPSRDIYFNGNIVGIPTFEKGEWLVYVPAKTRRLKISAKNCLPLEYTFTTKIESLRTYELKLQLPEKDPIRTVVMPTFGIYKSDPNFGIMVGIVKKHGAYLRYKSDFKKVDSDFECNLNGFIPETDTKVWFTGNEQKNRWAVTAGYMYRVIKPLYLYGGLGYGVRNFAWETAEGEYAKVLGASLKGFEFELGAIYRYRGFAVSLGFQTNQFKMTELNLGIGIML